MAKDNKTSRELSPEHLNELLTTLEARFEKNMSRHRGLEWARVRARLEASPEKLLSLKEMEGTGGEPDVVGHDKRTGEYGHVFVGHSGAQSYYSARGFRGWLRV